MSFSELNKMLGEDIGVGDTKPLSEKHLIMVVDDDYFLLNILKELLSQYYDLVLCKNGAEAVQKITTFVHTVILDIKMSNKDGFETFLEIKNKSSNVPIIFHSAFQNLKNPYEIMNNYKPFAYLRKGVSQNELLDTVASAVDYYKKILHNEILVKELGKNNEILEKKVTERTLELSEKNEILHQTLSKLQLANKKIVDSINYAKRIQSSLLPSFGLMKKYFRECFILWEPKDLVGGDFYQFYRVEDGFILVVADCTGHGVSGGFMTALAISVLHRIIEGEKTVYPKEILKKLNKIIKKSLRQDTEKSSSNDGLDAGICYISTRQKKLYFSAAKFSLNILQNGKISQIRGDRKSLGYKRSEFDYDFTIQEISITPGMSFYMYSDGIVDQLGGERGLPFGKTRIHEILIQNESLAMEQQKGIILDSLLKYQGNYERLDDITMVGFCIS